MSYGKYRGCATCWSDAKRYVHEKEMENFRLKQEREDAVAQLKAKEKCIDWLWCVRWTTPRRSNSEFKCEASQAGLRVFSCREDALMFVRSLREIMRPIKEKQDDELRANGCNIIFGPRSGGGSDEHPEETGEYVDFNNGYSVCIECRAVNHSPCEIAREFDIKGEVVEETK